MIAKADLVHGQYYWGDCRNADTARWNGEKNYFVYWRTCVMTGQGWVESICHPEDDDGHDLFIPEKLVDWGTQFIPLEPT